ncbi:MAG: YccF domain-containing protein [Clostridiales bacterium]|nr:YccF domain-containing protein [Clostridiales bacterium]MBR5975179.1 YccF domain-containing protein [Clostridiales bacterium]
MKTLGNILWIIFGGWICALSWLIAGCLWCITIVGAPVGVQCFKMASLSFLPFGKKVENDGGGVSCLLNVIWFFVSGLELAVEHFMFGLLLCLTIVGIPFGKQYFKLAHLSLAPFGKKITSGDHGSNNS